MQGNHPIIKRNDEQFIVETKTHYFFDIGVRAPYPALYCDTCGHMEFWEPDKERMNNDREVQVWKCTCGRKTETGTVL